MHLYLPSMRLRSNQVSSYYSLYLTMLLWYLDIILFYYTPTTKKYQCIEHILFIVNCSHGHWPMAIQLYGYLRILIYSFGQNKEPLVKQGAIVPTRSIQNHFWLGEGLGIGICVLPPSIVLSNQPWNWMNIRGCSSDATLPKKDKYCKGQTGKA
jgi:hypothetical protein